MSDDFGYPQGHPAPIGTISPYPLTEETEIYKKTLRKVVFRSVLFTAPSPG